MNIKAILAAAIVSLGAGAAGAATLDSSNYGACLGASFCVVDGIGVASLPPDSVISEQDYRGLAGLGVDSGTGTDGPDDEIQPYEGEGLLVDFTGIDANGVALTSIVLGHLYNPEEFDSDPIEIATIVATLEDDSISVIVIQAVDNTNIATFGDATVVRTNVEQGKFELTDLFLGMGVKKLLFTGDPTPLGPDGTDYSVVSISSVPLPAAAFLLLGGLGGLAAMRRKKS